jgi:hypothetical protein
MTLKLSVTLAAFGMLLLLQLLLESVPTVSRLLTLFFDAPDHL